MNPHLRGDVTALPAAPDCRCAGPCTPRCLASQFAMSSEHTEGTPCRLRPVCKPLTTLATAPHAFACAGITPQGAPPPCLLTREQWCAFSTPMTPGYDAHAAPMQMIRQRRDDAFVATRGSWNRRPSPGYEVVRIQLFENGRSTRIEPFLTGFLVDGGTGALGGRPVSPGEDGVRLVGDDSNVVTPQTLFSSL